MQLPKTKKIVTNQEGFLWEYGASQTIGKRQEQQDCFLIRELPECSGLIAVVADGMGGLDSGAGASDLVVNRMAAELEKQLKADWTATQISKLLLQITEKTGKELVAWCKKQRITAGSTLALVLVYRKELFFCAVGDSRIYLYRNDEKIRINEDHSLKNYLLRCKLRREEVPELYGSIYSYLGQDPIAEIDFSRKGMPLSPGDALLLCSDGVYQALPEEELPVTLSGKQMQNQADELIKKVLEKNMEQQDNATLLMLRCSEN